MGSNQTKIECPRCGVWCTLHAYKTEHQLHSPWCLSKRTTREMRAADEVMAGNMTGVLTHAGLIKRRPWRSWYWVDHKRDRADGPRYERVDVVTFEAFTPAWAYALALKLSRDKSLARKLGYTQKHKVIKKYETVPNQKTKSSTVYERKLVSSQRVAVDLDKVLPIEVRAEILRVAAVNIIARELIIDDPHAAGIIIRGMDQ